MNSAPQTRNYYPALDGLRGIAILLVIACHNFNFIPYFESGWVGVDLFFVLSGFLITDILLRTKGSDNFLRNFYIRRVLRIFPLYYAVLVLFFLLAPQVSSLQPQYHFYHQHAAMPWLHLQNWLYIFHRPPNDLMLMSHFWSLSVEEQFYLIWPFMVLLAPSGRRLAQIVFVLMAACILTRFCSWIYFGDGYTNFQSQFMTRIDGLCVGSLAAIWKLEGPQLAKKKMLRLTSILLATHLIIAILAKTVFPGLPHFRFLGYSTIALLFGCIVLLASYDQFSKPGRLLRNPALVYIGRISYGLYVFHWPLLTLSKILYLDKMVSGGWSYDHAYALLSVIAALATMAVSIASYHLFEKKILALKDVLTAPTFAARLRRRPGAKVKPVSIR